MAFRNSLARIQERTLMRTNVTVAIPICRCEKYIRQCIESLLTQDFRDFKIIIVEDPPFDRAKNIIKAFEDERITYVRNRTRLGISGSRNKCIELANAEYIFWTDGDCTVSHDWIKQGLETLLDLDCVGVEGKTYYVSEKYEPTFSDGVIENKNGGQFMTCNIAYKKSVLQKIGGFDDSYSYLEDRDLAVKAMKHGKIYFNPNMVVYHQKITLRPARFVKTGERLKNRVFLYKKSKERKFILWRIVFPLNLVSLIFPPLVFVSLFRNRYRTKEDFALFPFVYIRLIYERLSLWNTCAKERVFLI
jgi:GT2 family glycosyltransferase